MQLSVAVASCLVLLGAVIPVGANSAKPFEVFVGGTIAADTLADGATTTRLRASGRVGVYLHELSTEGMDRDGASGDVAAMFPGSMVAEFGLPSRERAYSHPDAVGFFAQAYPKLFTRHGLHPAAANVNGLDPTGKTQSLADWTDYAAVARTNGIVSLAPFADPNGSKWPTDFMDPFWDFTRSVCLKLGGLAVDSPPGFFWGREEGYRQHDLAKVAWAVSHGLRASVVISPWGKPAAFLKDTKRFVAFFVDHKVLPTEWVVETYDDPAKPAHPGNPLGPEGRAGTVDAVALWVAQNAPVARRSACMSRCGDPR